MADLHSRHHPGKNGDVMTHVDVNVAVLSPDSFLTKVVVHDRFHALIIGTQIGRRRLQESGRILPRSVNY